jgi:hypothetical protein
MATNTRAPSRGTGPSFGEIINDNAPYIGAMYLMNVVTFLAFVDHGALLQGRLEYTTLLSFGEGSTLVSTVTAGGFAIGFAAATLLALWYAASVFLAGEGGEVDAYALEERISAITVMPAIQLFAVVLCPVITGKSLAEGMKQLPELVGLLL